MPSKKGSSMPKPSHGSETEPHSHSRDLRRFVLEALGQEGCHVTMFFFIDLLIISYVFLLVPKMNSNRFISRLMDQKLILIIRISALTFLSSTGTFDLIFLLLFVISWNFELQRSFDGILH